MISALGSDANPCTLSAPCRTLAFAITATTAKGEINILDPADYGTLTIDKSISVVNGGVGSAGILVPSGGTGITINAGAADVIYLRGLIIEGAGVGSHGIVFNTGGFLTIENCVVRNLTSSGINLIPSASSPRSGEGEAGAIGAPARLSVVGATRLLPRLPSEGLVPRRRLVSGPQVKEFGA